MIQQLFKLMWNSKRNHSLLIIEIFISFLVLFAACSTIFHQYKQYQRPLGFSHENVWTINFNVLNAEEGSLKKIKNQLLNKIRSFPEVVAAGPSGGSMIFTGGTYRNYVHYKDAGASTDHLVLGNQDATVMDIELLQGRWFNEADEVGKTKCVVINQSMKKALFGEEDPIGKVFHVNPDDPETFKKVVGVIGNFKYRGDFQQPTNIFLNQQDPNSNHYDIMVKVQPETSAEFEVLLSKTIAQMTKGWQIEIGRMSEKKTFINRFTYIPTLILLIVCSFLIFNVLLGLFGILWYNINQRKGEIGLRRAMGATQENVAWQFIGEVVVVATFALILGLFFAVQFPLLDVFSVFGVAQTTYFQGILVAILSIYAIVVLCAFYPSWQASKIHPAVALHAD